MRSPHARADAVRLAPSRTAPDDRDGRVAALADHLATGRPATAILQAWCDAHGLARGPVVARKRRPVPAPEREARARRHLGADAALALRRVALVRGTLPLSLAELRWRRDRVPADCRRELAASDRPFGEVIAHLAPRRRTLVVDTPRSPRAVLTVEAVVVVDERPIAVVHERYLANLVAF